MLSADRCGVGRLASPLRQEEHLDNLFFSKPAHDQTCPTIHCESASSLLPMRGWRRGAPCMMRTLQSTGLNDGAMAGSIMWDCGAPSVVSSSMTSHPQPFCHVPRPSAESVGVQTFLQMHSSSWGVFVPNGCCDNISHAVSRGTCGRRVQ